MKEFVLGGTIGIEIAPLLGDMIGLLLSRLGLREWFLDLIPPALGERGDFGLDPLLESESEWE